MQFSDRIDAVNQAYRNLLELYQQGENTRFMVNYLNRHWSNSMSF
jgi:hypothetical protein